jgi:hypothetical protein
MAVVSADDELTGAATTATGGTCASTGGRAGIGRSDAGARFAYQ